MTFSQRAVEAAERAVAEVRGAIWTPNKPVSANYDHDVAVAAITAYHAALTVDGVALQGWQDISTAPKDHNILVVDEGVVSEAYYNGESDTWWLANTSEHDFDYTRSIYPTLWQPLPNPPAASEGEER